ncbi:MAG: flagellar hook-basal body complex protein FliE [Rhodospirillales bacterium]|nr:flagellar hook-basal body complex protein FliE [Rhodospirillales bacterium]
MTVSFANAAAAYIGAAKNAGVAGLEARSAPGSNFADMVKKATAAVAQNLRQGETATLQAAAGKADLTQVVTAVANAEVTLQSVVAVRDKVVQAYLDILRMPI